ncbi:MAG: HD domain-containing protein [Spirochaetales bacterium]|uniref:HD domain-containing protein n=1 Tax=Candidatus Thalassospirochaeta sargassi TaxID=3119039 RepID=A0AAJ1MP59_9SPIO|nr:HD domain-containing protein [Spirochaetales bacterium]
MRRFIKMSLGIGKLVKVAPNMMKAFILINIISISFIAVVYQILNIDDNNSDEYFRSFNIYVLSVIKSGGSPDDRLLNQYKELNELFYNLSPRMRAGTMLNPPVFFDEASSNDYSNTLKEHAAVVRQNLSNAVDFSYVIIGIMLFISACVSIAMLLVLFLAGKAVKEYNDEVHEGLEYIERILTFEAIPDYSSKKSNVIEVNQLSEAIYNLSEDMSFNRALIDTAFHGNLDKLMNELYNSISKRMPCERIALAFVNREGSCTAETAFTSYKKIFLQPGFSEKLTDTSLTGLMETGEPRIINDLKTYSANRKISKATALLLKEGIQSNITVPMMFDGSCLGFFFVSSILPDAYNEKNMHYISRVINLMKQKLYIEYLLQEVIAGTSNSFVGLMDEKDNETAAHIERMSQYSHIIARSYHENIRPLSARFMREILWFAPLHDIGKVSTPDSILLKKGRLSAEEFAVMQEHVEVGARVIKKMNHRLLDVVSTPLMQTAVELIAAHHEKYDGSGYPAGLCGEEIPLAGRIVAIADIFDALTSRRPYKEAYPVEKALEIMESEMRGSFDPEVYAAFKSGFEEILVVYNELKDK